MIDEQHLHPWDIIRNIRCRREFLSVTNVWSATGAILSKSQQGAPETIMDLCRQLKPPARISDKINEFAENGWRILGVASGRFGLHEALPQGAA